MKSFVSRHPAGSAATALALVGGAVFVLLYFEPQSLLIDDKVNEASPASVAANAAAGSGERSQGTAGDKVRPRTIARGEFQGLAHPGSGTALIITANGKHHLRFEDLQVDNGPDLKVYLSRAAAAGPEDALDDDFIDLGELKGNLGDQNYELPAGFNPAEFKSAVVWCKRFAVGFAVAPLKAD